ncbi:MAG TPA: NAD(P)-dependent oxidoreductase [Rhodopila sp.]|nr:NAD(P)-dependent oxidoreductase [Rhodopila sp.]
MPNSTAIGFIGLGQMGAPMAERLLAPDVRLHVFDTRPDAMAPFVERGAVACASPAAVAAEAEIVFACLPTARASEAVAAEVAGGSALRLYAEMSTIGREAIERIAALLAARGIACVDAPISGGPAGARAGTLAMLAAGDPEAVAALRSWQLRIGKTVFVMGEQPGQAQVMKLVNNLMFATNLVAACEGLAMGAKAGLDPDAMLAMVNAGTGRSMASERVLEEVLSGRFAFGAALSVLDKDVRLGLAEATALDVPMWTMEQAARVWRFAATQGAGTEDLTVVARFMEEWVRAKIRRPGAE